MRHPSQIATLNGCLDPAASFECDAASTRSGMWRKCALVGAGQCGIVERVTAMSRGISVAGVIAMALVGFGARGVAQRGGTTDENARVAQSRYPGTFRFCRIQFRDSPDGDGNGWYVDYPRADENLSERLSELTKIAITRDAQGTPAHVVFPLTDPELFTCPFVMMTEPGGAYFDDEEAARLRTYLLKGGFLWADDFWGTHAWEWWLGQLRKALPADAFPVVELPLDHPLYHTLFDITEVPQVPNIGLWLRAQITSERGADSPRELPHAVLDAHGRVMVYMTHNTDFGDAYEEEAVSPDYFRRFSVQCYRIGADVLLYAMTH